MTRSFDKLKFLARLRNGVDLKRLLSLARKANQRLSRQHRWRFSTQWGINPHWGMVPPQHVEIHHVREDLVFDGLGWFCGLPA